MRFLLHHLLWLILGGTLLLSAAPAQAQSCAPATSQGTAPAGWQTYCWLDFSTYNHATALTAAGQNFTFALSDGSTLSLNARVTTATGPTLVAATAPSWTGAAVGNTAFIGIPGRPILYQTAGGVTTVTFRNITITPPAGVSAVSAYSFVAADAESSNNGEALRFVTNGSGWTILDQVNPISGSTYPAISGTGTTTFNITGVAGTVGSYIVGSNSPTTVTTTLTGGGLQGVMFAVRFASIRLNKQISGARINAADQFTIRINATSTGSVLASGTTSGTGNGPFAATALTVASGIPLTLVESMAGGSSSALSQYQARLTCTNATGGSTTPLPVNAATTSYNFGALQFGDQVICTFTNTPLPHIRLRKLMGTGGRQFSTDQFTVRIAQGATVIASSTTSGTGSTVTGGDTGMTQVTAGNAHILDEIAAGGSLSQYTPTMACTNAASGSSTVLTATMPGTITPQIGDVITCTITNTRKAANAVLEFEKTSALVSDPLNGSINPKHIPGAIVRYSLLVRNTGSLPVDASTIVLRDVLPPGMTYDASTPVQFTNGAVASGLNAFNPATMVTYSNQAGGGAPFTYTPTSGYDPNVRGLRIAPTGTMAAASAAGQPGFTISFLCRVN